MSGDAAPAGAGSTAGAGPTDVGGAGVGGADVRSTGAGSADAGSADVGPRATVTLDAVPGLGGLYARGVAAPVLRHLPARLPRGAASYGPGLAVPPVTLRVAGVDTGDDATRERLAAFSRLVGEPASDVLPAGFVHVLAFPVATALMVRDDFPLPLLGMVHLANTVEQRRPVRLGDRLEVRAWARDLRAHRRGVQVELVTEVRTDPADDEPAWRGVSTYLAKGVEGTSLPEVPELVDRSADAQWTSPFPTSRWVLDAGVGRRYAAVSGDRNPIHLSALSARALGFPRAIAHGMYTASRALASVARERGDAYDWSVEFAKPVLLPGTVDVSVVAADGGGHDGGRGRGWVYQAWDARRGVRHLAGSVVPR